MFSFYINTKDSNSQPHACATNHWTNSPALDRHPFSMVICRLCFHGNFSSFILMPPKHPRITLPLLSTRFFLTTNSVSIFIITSDNAPKIDESGIYLNRLTLFQWLHPDNNPMAQDLLSNLARSPCCLGHFHLLTKWCKQNAHTGKLENKITSMCDETGCWQWGQKR